MYNFHYIMVMLLIMVCTLYIVSYTVYNVHILFVSSHVSIYVILTINFNNVNINNNNINTTDNLFVDILIEISIYYQLLQMNNVLISCKVLLKLIVIIIILINLYTTILYIYINNIQIRNTIF